MFGRVRVIFTRRYLRTQGIALVGMRKLIAAMKLRLNFAPKKQRIDKIYIIPGDRHSSFTQAASTNASKMPK